MSLVELMQLRGGDVRTFSLRSFTFMKQTISIGITPGSEEGHPWVYVYINSRYYTTLHF
jgi:hypothetical protein